MLIHPSLIETATTQATRITPDLISLPPTQPLDISAWNVGILPE